MKDKLKKFYRDHKHGVDTGVSVASGVIALICVKQARGMRIVGVDLAKHDDIACVGVYKKNGQASFWHSKPTND